MENSPRKMTTPEKDFEPLSHKARDGCSRLLKPEKEDLKEQPKDMLSKRGAGRGLSGQKAKLDLWGGEYGFLKTVRSMERCPPPFQPQPLKSQPRT